MGLFDSLSTAVKSATVAMTSNSTANYSNNPAAANAEIKRLGQVYNDAAKKGDKASMTAANARANQIRDAAGLAGSYDRNTGASYAGGGVALVKKAQTTSENYPDGKTVAKAASVPAASGTQDWQKKLEYYKTNPDEGFKEIARAGWIYEQKKNTDPKGAQQAHIWANQVREALGVSDLFDKDSGAPLWDQLKGKDGFSSFIPLTAPTAPRTTNENYPDGTSNANGGTYKGDHFDFATADRPLLDHPTALPTMSLAQGASDTMHRLFDVVDFSLAFIGKYAMWILIPFILVATSKVFSMKATVGAKGK